MIHGRGYDTDDSRNGEEVVEVVPVELDCDSIEDCGVFVDDLNFGSVSS